MSAWKLDDKRWVKARKGKWKEMRSRLQQLQIVPKEIGFLKDYFLTGQFRPHSYAHAKPFFEFWLHPEPSEELLENIVEDYRGDPRRKQQIKNMQHFVQSQMAGAQHTRSSEHMFKHDGSSVSFFDGWEDLFYQRFFKHRFVREDYPNLSDEEFSYFAKRQFNCSIATIEHVIYAENAEINPHSLALRRIPYWHDALKLGYFRLLGFDGFVKRVDWNLANPEECDPLQLKFTQEVNGVLSDPELPERAKQDIATIRAGGEFEVENMAIFEPKAKLIEDRLSKKKAHRRQAI
ncbi:hypothetical protein [Algibacillus agarilyticus]|uniref:hypothetical protein n=1 Tax=Algibacillus agarilyticus TaxID=2234133 RepID=UPI000DD0CF33|nr:hypothetical protein [Algibacillus agarilyticus]